MKILATLVGLLVVTVSYAQESPVKEKSNSPQSTGDMPILKGHGNALDMPTRNGRGEALAIPNRPTPAPDELSEQSAMIMKSLKGEIEQFLADSLNREKPRNTLPNKKN